MSFRRTVQALTISALVVVGGLVGNAPALAGTQLFQGRAVGGTPETALHRAEERANATASAAGYQPATQCTPIQAFAREIASSAWEGTVVISCTD